MAKVMKNKHSANASVFTFHNSDHSEFIYHKSHRNFIDFLTDHEKHVSDRQTAWKATPRATGKTPLECQKLHVFYTDQSPMNTSHSPPIVKSLVIPVYTRVLYLPGLSWQDRAASNLEGPQKGTEVNMYTILTLFRPGFF